MKIYSEERATTKERGVVKEEKRKFRRKWKIGKEGFRTRRKKERSEKMSGEKKKIERGSEFEVGAMREKN